MRNVMKICAVLTILGLAGSTERAFGQAGSSGPAGQPASGPGPIPHVRPRHDRAVRESLTEIARDESPTISSSRPTRRPETATTAPGTVQQSLGNPNTVTTNPATTAPGTVTTGRIPSTTCRDLSREPIGSLPDGGTGEPGMNYTSVNPMGVTMAPGSYYSDCR